MLWQDWNTPTQGKAIGVEESENRFVLEPAMSYGVLLPDGADVHRTLQQLKQLEEEDPQLHIAWNSQTEEIQIQAHGRSAAGDFKRDDPAEVRFGTGIWRRQGGVS